MKNIQSIQTEKEEYENSVLTWNGNSVNIGLTTGHEFETGDYIALSGISTDSLEI